MTNRCRDLAPIDLMWICTWYKHFNLIASLKSIKFSTQPYSWERHFMTMLTVVWPNSNSGSTCNVVFRSASHQRLVLDGFCSFVSSRLSRNLVWRCWVKMLLCHLMTPLYLCYQYILKWNFTKYFAKEHGELKLTERCFQLLVGNLITILMHTIHLWIV